MREADEEMKGELCKWEEVSKQLTPKVFQTSSGFFQDNRKAINLLHRSHGEHHAFVLGTQG